MSTRYQDSLKTPKKSEHSFAHIVRILGKGKTGSRSLTRAEAYTAMSMILAGQVEDVQLGAFLMLLRVKEESIEELSGFVSAARDYITPPQQTIHIDLDWSSYAGKKKQLPWFILSCLLLAEQGIRVFMHGCKGHTPGRLYTERVIRELGLNVAQNWSKVNCDLAKNNFAFMPLSALCPPLDNIINLRYYLGLRSPVHTLARLLNPLSAPCSVQSVFHPNYANKHQHAALSLGQTYAAVFKGEGGEAERRPEATCLVKTVNNAQADEEQWEKLLEGRQPRPAQLQVSDMKALWRGDLCNDYAHQAVIGTCAIALKLLNKADSQQHALELAKKAWQARQVTRFN